MSKSLLRPQTSVDKSFELLLKLQLYYNLCFLLVQLDLFPQYYIVCASIGSLLFFRIIGNIRLYKQSFPHAFIIIFTLYCIYSLYVVTNFNGNYSLSNILRYTYLPSGILFYIAPIIVFRYANLCTFSILRRFVFKQTLLYINLLVVFVLIDLVKGVSLEVIVNHFECLQLYLGGGLVFLLIFQDSFVIKQKRVIWIGVFITAILAAVFARRTILATYVLGFGFYFLGKFLGGNSLPRKMLLLALCSILLLVGYSLIIRYGETLFPTLAGRIQDDTRSGVELEVLYIIERSGKFLSGLGINSFYYSEYIQEIRDGCETGYLNMLMKGGVVYIVLYYLLCLPAIIGLLFKKHKNKQMWNIWLYLILVLVVGNAASSTFTFSIRYIVFMYLLLCLYNKKTKSNIYEI